jgi:hypothetical protein
MIRSIHLVIVSSIVVLACTRQAPVTALPQPEPRVKPNDGVLTPGRAHIAYQFNNEPLIIQDADGPGAGPVLYHGRQLTPDQIKSVKALNVTEARKRFGDQTLVGAILIELK